MHLTWLLKNGLGIPGEGKAFPVEAPGKPKLSGIGNSLGGTGSQHPEAVVVLGIDGSQRGGKVW